MNIVVPKRFKRTGTGCTFFLAGPVRGGGDWQAKAVEFMKGHLDQFDTVAVPYYHRKDGRPFPLFEKHKNEGEPGLFDRQLDWERHYIKEAGKNGCLIFWLPKESVADPRPDGNYGRDTRGEVARYSMKRLVDSTFKTVIGGEEGFSGIDQIWRNWFADQDEGSDALVSKQSALFPTLEETLLEALRLAGR